MDLFSKDYSEFASKTEAEIESIAETPEGHDAKFYLGAYMFEGLNPDQIKVNTKKGFNWIKEAAENGQLDAQEYIAIHEIQKSKVPNIKTVIKYLSNVVEAGISSRAC